MGALAEKNVKRMWNRRINGAFLLYRKQKRGKKRCNKNNTSYVECLVEMPEKRWKNMFFYIYMWRSM